MATYIFIPIESKWYIELSYKPLTASITYSKVPHNVARALLYVKLVTGYEEFVPNIS